MKASKHDAFVVETGGILDITARKTRCAKNAKNALCTRPSQHPYSTNSLRKASLIFFSFI